MLTWRTYKAPVQYQGKRSGKPKREERARPAPIRAAQVVR